MAGKLDDDTEQVLGERKLLGVQTREKPLITKVNEKTKSSNFRLVFTLVTL